MCNPPDEVDFKSIDAPKIKGDYLFSWGGETIVGNINYIFNWINNENLHVHTFSKNGVIIELEIHDYANLWHEELSPVTDIQYKDDE